MMATMMLLVSSWGKTSKPGSSPGLHQRIYASMDAAMSRAGPLKAWQVFPRFKLVAGEGVSFLVAEEAPYIEYVARAGVRSKAGVFTKAHCGALAHLEEEEMAAVLLRLFLGESAQILALRAPAVHLHLLDTTPYRSGVKVRGWQYHSTRQCLAFRPTEQIRPNTLRG